MTQEDFLKIESSQRQHNELLEHDSRQYAADLQADYMLFSMLKPRVYRDGNQWCVLYGNDIQEGIAGFGDSISDAVKNWNYSFNKMEAK
jgi:hypothetical protein